MKNAPNTHPNKANEGGKAPGNEVAEAIKTEAESTTNAISSSGTKNVNCHIINGQRLRTCICGISNCCTIMRKWAEFGSFHGYKAGYLSLPYGTEVGTALGLFTNGFLQRAIVHAMHRSPLMAKNLAEERFSSHKDRKFVAYKHFNPILFPVLDTWLGHVSLSDKYRIPTSIAQSGTIFLSDADKCVGMHSTDYYCIPNFFEIEKDLDHTIGKQGRRPLASRASVTPLSPTLTSSTSANVVTPPPDNAVIPVSRLDPEERRMIQAIRRAEANPVGMAAEVMFLRSQLDTLKAELTKTRERETVDQANLKRLQKKLEEALVYQKLLVPDNSGMTRRTLLCDDWHEAHPYASPFLTGHNWKSYKVLIDACFQVSILTPIPEHISAFEKITMCIMWIRCGYEVIPIALIYGRSDSSVSNYLQEWMPQVGFIGQCLSELYLDLTHNYLSREDCEQFGIKYSTDEGLSKLTI